MSPSASPGALPHTPGPACSVQTFQGPSADLPGALRDRIPFAYTCHLPGSRELPLRAMLLNSSAPWSYAGNMRMGTWAAPCRQDCVLQYPVGVDTASQGPQIRSCACKPSPTRAEPLSLPQRDGISMCVGSWRGRRRGQAQPP